MVFDYRQTFPFSLALCGCAAAGGGWIGFDDWFIISTFRSRERERIDIFFPQIFLKCFKCRFRLSALGSLLYYFEIRHVLDSRDQHLFRFYYFLHLFFIAWYISQRWRNNCFIYDFFYRTCKGFPLKNRQKVAASVVVVVALLILQDYSRAGFYFIHFSGINKFNSLHAPTYSRKPKKLSLLISIVYQWYITIRKSKPP